MNLKTEAGVRQFEAIASVDAPPLTSNPRQIADFTPTGALHRVDLLRSLVREQA